MHERHHAARQILLGLSRRRPMKPPEESTWNPTQEELREVAEDVEADQWIEVDQWISERRPIREAAIASELAHRHNVKGSHEDRK